MYVLIGEVRYKEKELRPVHSQGFLVHKQMGRDLGTRTGVFLVFWCERLKADAVPVIFLLRNTAFVLCKNSAKFSPVGNVSGTATGEEQVA